MQTSVREKQRVHQRKVLGIFLITGQFQGKHLERFCVVSWRRWTQRQDFSFAFARHSGVSFIVCQSYWLKPPAFEVTPSCLITATDCEQAAKNKWRKQKAEHRSEMCSVQRVWENLGHSSLSERKRKTHFNAKSQHRNSKSSPELCTTLGSGVVNSPLHWFILVYLLFFSRFCVGDKFFLKNNMILCQMDYEEGQLNGSFETQVQ